METLEDNYKILIKFMKTDTRLARLFAQSQFCKKLLNYVCDIEPNYDAAKFLLESGADIDQIDEDGWKPIHNAAVWNVSLVKLLKSYGADLNSITNYFTKESVLMVAVRHTELEVVSYLAPLVNANYRDHRGNTALHTLAIEFNHNPEVIEEFSKILLKYVDPTIKNKDGKTAADYCSYLMENYNNLKKYGSVKEIERKLAMFEELQNAIQKI